MITDDVSATVRAGLSSGLEIPLRRLSRIPEDGCATLGGRGRALGWEVRYGTPAVCSQTSNPAMPRVLIVDDDDIVRRLIGLLLESAGYETTSAAHGSEA